MQRAAYSAWIDVMCWANEAWILGGYGEAVENFAQ